MSFLKPTVSSSSRSKATLAERPNAASNKGFATRIHNALFVRSPRAASATRSPSLTDFTTRCDSVIQRAQQLLERTKDQEQQVARALEQRLLQSPARRAYSQGNATPVQPAAPPTTPLPLNEAPSSGWFPWSSPPRTPLAVTPSSPTPSTSPSLFQRVRQSLHRFSGQLPPPTPLPPLPVAVEATPPASHRKSVAFVSPDKLEHITPTKMQRAFDEAAEEDAVDAAVTPMPVAPPPSTVKRNRSHSTDAAAEETHMKTVRTEKKSTSPAQDTVSLHRREHLAMIEFIRSNTVKKCLASYNRAQLAGCLHAEGVAKVDDNTTKKKLVEELKALLEK